MTDRKAAAFDAEIEAWAQAPEIFKELARAVDRWAQAKNDLSSNGKRKAGVHTVRFLIHEVNGEAHGLEQTKVTRDAAKVQQPSKRSKGIAKTAQRSQGQLKPKGFSKSNGFKTLRGF